MFFKEQNRGFGGKTHEVFFGCFKRNGFFLLTDPLRPVRYSGRLKTDFEKTDSDSF